MGEYAENWLKIEEGLGVRPTLSGTAEEMRAQHGGLMSVMKPDYPPLPTSVTTQDGSHGTFNYRVYRPSPPQDSTHLPLGVYFHPGGLVVGPSHADEYFCAVTAASNKTMIVAIHYRLSPENKAPAHLEDALTGLEWAYENASSFGGDPERMYAMGVSAGAGLAISATRKILLGQSTLQPGVIKALVAFCPILLHPDNIPETLKATHTSSVQRGENTPLVDGKSLRVFLNMTSLSPGDKDYFPGLDTASLGKLPPTYMTTCEMDSLRDDGRILADTLNRAGVQTKHDHYPGLPHCFWIFPLLLEAHQFMKDAERGVGWAIDQLKP